VDATAPLADSAQTAGAIFNTEADFVDSGGTTHQLQLELLNPDKGIGIGTSLKVPVGKVNSATLAATTGTTSTTTGTIGSGTTNGTVNNGTTTGNTTTGTSTTTQTPNEFAVAFDGTTDLVPFTFGGASNTGSDGIMLSSHAAAYDLSIAGAISGQLTLTNITSSTTSTTGLPPIKVEAETVSADGTRHVVVASTTVQPDGSFLLYPLATTSSSIPLYYDVVIHGPGIATIIVKSVQVPRPSTNTNTSTANTSTNTGTASSITPNIMNNGTTSNSTANNSTANNNTANNNTANNSTTSLPTITAVTIGTLTPRTATTYTATVSTSTANPLSAGANVGFYQTINRQGEVPYLIESSPIDPFNQNFFNPQGLSAGTIDSGTWSTSGGAISVVSAAPREGTGRYIVAATAPFYADGPVSANSPTVAAPSSGTGPVSVVLPGLALASGAVPGSLTATISQATPGKYDQGQLLVSNNGALVAAVSLNSALSQGGGSVGFSSLPAGTPTSLYYLSVRVWNSRNPADTLQRQWYPNPIDMRSNLSGALDLTIN
ncbi:MAG TPA: hypothetical protein VKB72_06600, partial [Steroidobacteraceae bacterium]|nr:hypothetical protein [Steroidobacteraceae bacterium]